ncbi:hypothetical protein [Actinacidiphila sp. bgisy167]|uniref:hypothetical protein n=1 Tax=Actinacidiphila sp. bgisy167 TaxID=3413797 RepID=UPI003D74EDB9
MRHLTLAEVTDLARLACGGEPPALREPGLSPSKTAAASHAVRLHDPGPSASRL